MKKIVIVGAAFIVAIGGIVAFGVVNKSSKASTSNMIKIGGGLIHLVTLPHMEKLSKMVLTLL